MDSRHFQSQRNGIKDSDNIELSSAYITKMQNTTKFGTLTINKTALSTKTAISRKRLDVSIGKVNCIIN